MKQLHLIALSLALTGCSTPLTQRGQEISLVHGISSDLVVDCQRLGTVTGHADTIWGN